MLSVLLIFMQPLLLFLLLIAVVYGGRKMVRGRQFRKDKQALNFSGIHSPLSFIPLLSFLVAVLLLLLFSYLLDCLLVACYLLLLFRCAQKKKKKCGYGGGVRERGYTRGGGIWSEEKERRVKERIGATFTWCSFSSFWVLLSGQCFLITILTHSRCNY